MYPTVQAPRTVSVAVTVTPPSAKYPNAQTAFRAGWVPRVTNLACTGAQCVEFACASRVTSATVVNWSAPGEGRARMENACAIQTASKDGWANSVNSMDARGSMGTVMATGCATRIQENANVIRCGLGTTVEQRTAWGHLPAQVKGAVTRSSFQGGATAKETGPARRATHRVSMA